MENTINKVEELKLFEQTQRESLGIIDQPNIEQWRDQNITTFTMKDKATTTLLSTGFPDASLEFMAGALSLCGVTMEPIKTPGNSAMKVGKEFGNRGQCNPTYYTVGSLVEYLIDLRDNKGLSAKQIIKDYAFITAGGCGPCRMGMYATEFRKALRDSGFKGFRVLIITKTGGSTSVDSSGINFPTLVILKMFAGILIADVLNVMHKRIKTYEIEKGSADKALVECKKLFSIAFRKKKSLIYTAWKCRKIFGKVNVDRKVIKPKILVQGEFWAKTTEGEGNYGLYDFIQAEGGEPIIETITDWLVHQVWRAQWATRQRKNLKQQDAEGDGLKGTNLWLHGMTLKLVEKMLRVSFYSFAKIMGLSDFVITDNEHLAHLAHEHFDIHLDGGEDHMEIGHHIHTAKEKTANMVISVKPFTCLSSSGVSDGVQSIVTEMYPQSIFCSIETSGDASANFYSRIQMQLFKAKQAAIKDMEEAYKKYEITKEEVTEYLDKHPKLNNALSVYPHEWACNSANLVAEVARRRT